MFHDSSQLGIMCAQKKKTTTYASLNGWSGCAMKHRLNSIKTVMLPELHLVDAAPLALTLKS